MRIGEGTFLNLGVMVASTALVEIGAHCMLANGCFVTDGNHRFDDPDMPITWQGFTSKGPTRIGDNTWLGANVVVTSGVTIGERCVVGANAVVTTDIPGGLDRGGRPGPRAQARSNGRAGCYFASDDLDAEDHRAEEDGGAHEAQDDVRRRGGAGAPLTVLAARVKPTSAGAKAPETTSPASAAAQISSKSLPKSMAAIMRRP